MYRVYTTADGDVNIHTCEAMCVFDSDDIGTRNGIKYYILVHYLIWEGNIEKLPFIEARAQIHLT